MDTLERIFKTELANLTDEQVEDFLVEMLHCIELGYSTEEAYSLVTDIPWTGSSFTEIH